LAVKHSVEVWRCAEGVQLRWGCLREHGLRRSASPRKRAAGWSTPVGRGNLPCLNHASPGVRCPPSLSLGVWFGGVDPELLRRPSDCLRFLRPSLPLVGEEAVGGGGGLDPAEESVATRVAAAEPAEEPAGAPAEEPTAARSVLATSILCE
jgi:hypothetical protein